MKVLENERKKRKTFCLNEGKHRATLHVQYKGRKILWGATCTTRGKCLFFQISHNVTIYTLLRTLKGAENLIPFNHNQEKNCCTVNDFNDFLKRKCLVFLQPQVSFLSQCTKLSIKNVPLTTL